MVKLTRNAKLILQRFLAKNKEGEIIETEEEMFERVARNIASIDENYNQDSRKAEKEFLQVMKNLEFLPNIPVLANANRPLQQLAACFVAEQPILTNPGLKPISEIEIGDKVATHTGETKTVINKIIREINEFIYKVKIKGIFNNTLTVTSEHPILGLKREDLRCIREKNKLCSDFHKKYCYRQNLQYKKNCEYLNKKNISPKWISVKDLERGDFVVVTTNREIKNKEELILSEMVPKEEYLIYNTFLRARGRPNKGTQIPDKIKIDNDLMRLFGYWLADGSLSYHYGKPAVVRFTFNKKEENFCNDVLNLIKNKFNLTCKKEFNSKQNTIQLRFNSTIVACLFEKLFNKGFKNKDLPEWVMNLPFEKQFFLLIGLFRGDGCHKNGKEQDIFFLSVSNYNLATKIWNILLRLGYNFNINCRKPKGATTFAYRISAAPSECEELVKAVNKNKYIKRKRFLQYIRLGDLILKPITKIDKFNFKGKVYNLEIENNHSYVANCVAVHNCFVIPIEDDLSAIFQAVKEMALIQKSGGGTGFSFSRLRAEGSIAADTGGVASGPVSFMKVFDTATGAIKEGGIRRGANMGILSVEHPDIEKFINAKNSGDFPNFNISVALTDKFMKAVEKNKNYELIDPHTKKVTARKKARDIFNLICKNAHFNGEPGVIFIDIINKKNTTPKEKIEATNPCGETPLLPYESCILGSINLAKITEDKLDYEKLARLVKIAVHFLDNTIDASKFPIPEITKKVQLNRKIGLGVMGFADCLIKQGISYNNKEAIEQARKIMSFIQSKAKEASRELAVLRGDFPNIKNSIYQGKRMRNSTLTTIAPTGTIGIIADCSDGIEPLFNVIYERYTTYGLMTEFNPLFKEIAEKYNLTNKELMNIAEKGSIQKTKLPKQVKRIFVTAHDIKLEQHIRIQAEFQKYTDNAISKTVNLKNNAKVEDVKKTILLAYKLGCKGLTVYRDKSRKKQILRLCKCKLR